MFGESSPIHYTFVATPAPLWMVPTKVRILKTGVADWCTATTVPEPVDVPNLMSQDRAEVIRIILLESGTGVNLPRSFPKAAIVKEATRHPHFVQSDVLPIPIRSDVPRSAIESNLKAVTQRKTTITLRPPPPRYGIGCNPTPNWEVGRMYREFHSDTTLTGLIFPAADARPGTCCTAEILPEILRGKYKSPHRCIFWVRPPYLRKWGRIGTIEYQAHR